MNRAFIWITRGVYTFFGLVFVSVVAFKVFQPVQVLPRIRLGPGYWLLDQDGQRLTNEDMRGKVVLYSFLYTRCPGDCYGIVPLLQKVQVQGPQIMGDIPFAIVTITLDPAHDTPEVLKAYAQQVGAQPGLWYFATHPDPKRLKLIVGAGFGVWYEPQPDGSVRFAPRYVLVDGWGIVRGDYKYETIASTEERILRHLGVLAEEIQNSQGSAKLAYEAAHFFLCYAP
ncbi:MAG: SCO family protein [Chloroflexi bacterium]|nr:SCO family protein [Chloroflexota bacterium]